MFELNTYVFSKYGHLKKNWLLILLFFKHILKIGSVYVFIIPVRECSISLTASFLNFALQNFEEKKKTAESADKCGYRPRKKSEERGGGGSQTFLLLGWQKKM
jgi:hypothetical protein